MNTDTRIERYTLKDLEAYKPDPANNIIGSGFLRRGVGTLLTGQTGIGKSTLSTQGAVCVSSGLDFLGMRVLEPRRVLILQAENDIDDLHSTIPPIVSALNADKHLVQDNLIICRSHASEGEFISELGDLAKDVKPDLIIIDPYQSFIGEADMNSSRSFLSWAPGIERIIRMQKSALLLIAHSGKPGYNQSKNNAGSYLAAGTSTISNWARASCELIPTTKAKDHFRLTFSKNPSRTGLRNLETGSIVREIFIKHSSDPTVPVWEVTTEPPPKARHDFEYDEKIREIFITNPNQSLRAIANAVGCNKDTVSEALKRMSLKR